MELNSRVKVEIVKSIAMSANCTTVTDGLNFLVHYWNHSNIGEGLHENDTQSKIDSNTPRQE